MTDATGAAEDRLAVRDDLVRDLATESMGAVETVTRFHLEASGSGLTTGHEVLLAAGGAPVLVYVDGAPRYPARDDVPRIRLDSDEVVDVWVYPADPALPALAPVVFPESADVLLDRMGLPTDSLQLDMLSFRPGKRAVIRARTRAQTLYLKVVTPSRVERIVAAHHEWIAAGLPAPALAGWADDGLVALEARHGIVASEALDRLGSTFVDSLAGLRARIATVESAAPARASLLDRIAWYADGLRAIAPSDSARIEATVARIHSLAAASAPLPEAVTVHGDLHLGQLFVDDELDIVGIIDIDTAGLGDPADDEAAMWAHVAVTAYYRAQTGSTVGAGVARDLADALEAGWRRPGDPGYRGRTAAIAATHLLAHGLAGVAPTSVFLDGVDEILRRHESALIALSPGSHEPSGS